MHRRQIHQLDLHVFKRHHSRQRHARGERVVRHVRLRVREPSHQQRLAAVGRPHQGHLSHTLFFDAVDNSGAAGGPPCRLSAELGEPALQFRLHLLRSLVARNRGHHLFQGRDFLLRRLGALEASLGFQVNGGQVCGHGYPPSGRRLLCAELCLRTKGGSCWEEGLVQMPTSSQGFSLFHSTLSKLCPTNRPISDFWPTTVLTRHKCPTFNRTLCRPALCFHIYFRIDLHF